MVEISKGLKILLLINAIIGLIFAFLYLAISHIYLSFIQWSFYDPYYSWLFGGTQLILSIFTLLAIKRTEWKQIRIIFELIIGWQLTILILNIIGLILIPAPITSLISTWVNNFLLIILIIANLYFYTKQEI
ncbi:MAG: hypothetical protein ACXAC5_16250 [Promethearchaeota archaeon]